MQMEEDFRRRLEGVLSCPTAPFHEGYVHAYLREAVRASRRLRDRIDAYGNLEVIYGAGRPKLYFACHTDHPALLSNGDGTATVKGGIRPEELVGAKLRTLDGTGPGATVSGVVKKERPAVVRIKGLVRKGMPLILDLPDFRFSGDRIRARAIDDLCAVAACMTAADRLARSNWKGRVGFLFTRAEEVGFVGALGWAKATRLPRSTTIVNLEMSKALPHTPQGEGPILRIGDRLSIFSQEVALGLEAAAKAQEIPYQRALMDGGACEATVFSRAGFRAGALCLPLHNTHNHARGGGMGLENVHQEDAENLVRWLVAYARSFGKRPPADRLDRRLESLWRKERAKLERSADQGRGT
ncbi:MAG: M28 family peptidase [Planctomycetota bacterium]|jgi:endoglucanase